MAFPFKTYDYAALSISDLLEARDLYHLHLMNKKNVVATAIGYYRIRKIDDWPTRDYPNPDNSKNKAIPRTLGNSEIRPYSWPAILVFVEQWEEEENLIGSTNADIVPKTLYLPNGKAIPVCVIEAKKVAAANDAVNLAGLQFPRNVISGGFPLIMDVQNEKRIASFGCLVSDGHLIYALTNRHVTGKKGNPVKTVLCGKETVVGHSSDLQIGKVPFAKMYPTLKGKSVFLNVDIGLVEINDVSQWKTEIFTIGQFDELIDLDTNNITLRLINQRVTGFGAASGEKIEGEIQALFYRYKSIGGFEYVCDFLIGPRTKEVPYEKGDESKTLTVQRGDSGTLMLMEIEKDNADMALEEKDNKHQVKTTLHPFGVLWGMHQFTDSGSSVKQPFILASCLSTVCNLLNVELIRDWNIDLTNTWGKTGHFKIGAKACELVSNHKLSTLLMANQKNIGYTDADLQSGNVVSGKFTHDFVPLADVADIIWRSTRPSDESNHFADVDEANEQVMGGKSLLELSLSDDQNIDIDFWLDYDRQMDEVAPKAKPRRGALPFRVWQMYNQMIKSLEEKDLIGFIVSGGTMSHYVGDACQPLHISYLHHGRNEGETKVHSDYETTLIDKKMVELFTGVDMIQKKVKAENDLIGKSGKEAAKRVLQLMNNTTKNLPPLEVVECWAGSNGRGKWDNLWNVLGQKTIENIAEGSRVMAILWESAWENGKGNQHFQNHDLVNLDEKELKVKYMDDAFVPSFSLDDTDDYKNVCF
jgi:hypothetical protein